MSIINWVFERSATGLTRLCNLGAGSVDNKTFHTEGSPYLSRYYLRRRRRQEDQDEKPGLFSVYLHYFHRGDEDDALHNHPWGFSFSIILTNGYVEERWTIDGIKKRTFRPGSINVIRHNDFHRVDLINPEQGAWTLFFAGPRVQEAWGFWHPTYQRDFVPWTKFIKNRDANAQPSRQN